MPSAITQTWRKIHKQDIAFTTNPSGATAAVQVFGVEDPVTLDLVDAVLLTMFKQAANDAAAATAGVPVGGIYYHTGDSALHTRMA